MVFESGKHGLAKLINRKKFYFICGSLFGDSHFFIYRDAKRIISCEYFIKNIYLQCKGFSIIIKVG